MAEILAEPGRITGLGPEIGGKIISACSLLTQSGLARSRSRFAAPASQLTDLDDDDLVIVRFSRTDHSTMAGPLPVPSLSLA